MSDPAGGAIMLFCTKTAGGVGEGGEAVSPAPGVAVGEGSAVGAGVVPVVGLNGIATSVALSPEGHETPLALPSATR